MCRVSLTCLETSFGQSIAETTLDISRVHPMELHRLRNHFHLRFGVMVVLVTIIAVWITFAIFFTIVRWCAAFGCIWTAIFLSYKHESTPK